VSGVTRAEVLRWISESRDEWHARTSGAGHAMTWRLDDQGPGHALTWYGTCANCGATMSVFEGGTSIGESAWCARDMPCKGPGTAWQQAMVRELAQERVARAVSGFGQAVKDNADRAWLAGQGIRARRAADVAGTWKQLVAAAGGFEPETDAHLTAWMAGEAAGMAAYAEAVTDVYETAVNTVGLDPASMQALHEYAAAAATAARAMAAARARFTAHYQAAREFTAAGGVLPHDGRWMTGEGD